MAFEYGESYYGLRTFGSSVGDVKDASATVTATSGANSVDWIVTIGGSASTTVTSSATCSGEVVIIEETDTRNYGDWNYGVGVFNGGQDDLQTVITATSTVTAVGARVRIATASTTANSGATVGVRRVPEGSALINGASTTSVTTTGNGARIRTGQATSTTTSSITESVMRVRTSPQTANAVATTSASGVFMISASSTVSVASTSAAICNRVRFGSGVPTAVASITVLGYATRGGIASTGSTHTNEVTVQEVSGSNKYFINGVQQETIQLVEGNTYVFNYPSAHPVRFSTTSDGTHNSGTEYTTGVTHNSSTQSTIVVADGTPDLYYYCQHHTGMGGSSPTPNNSSNSSITSDSEKIFQGHAVTQPEATVNATCNRVQRVGGIVSSTSVTTTIGREKWETIINNTVTWTEIAA
tara:strand:- start:1893 stop:3131 length:1239 start_codon:yes stop_codon:yes gene_type:complete